MISRSQGEAGLVAGLTGLVLDGQLGQDHLHTGRVFVQPLEQGLFGRLAFTQGNGAELAYFAFLFRG